MLSQHRSTTLHLSEQSVQTVLEDLSSQLISYIAQTMDSDWRDERSWNIQLKRLPTIPKLAIHHNFTLIGALIDILGLTCGGTDIAISLWKRF